MTGQTIVIATPHARYDKLERILREVHGFTVVRFRERSALTAEALRAVQPSHVFFPHWSCVIPDTIFGQFECVIFHMSDVPFGRGGSPLQNLVVRGIEDTQLSAIRCSDVIDGGPVYLKKPLSLLGSAEEIFVRAAHLMEGMVAEIVVGRLAPVAQIGEPTVFARRRPEDGDIGSLAELGRVHDHIRMLDADGYPAAFLRTGALRLEFSRSRLSHDHVMADVRITLTDEGRKP
jgi:methionyl-tRNA formyltransferase